MNETLNNLFIQLSKRAEKVDRQVLIDSFVDVGPLLSVLSTIDNQVLYGRRGTGKTHAFVYLSETVRRRGDLSVYVDLRTVGSTGGLYADTTYPLAERATRLLVDTLAAMHEELLTAANEDQTLNLSEVGPILNELANAIIEVVVRGPVKQQVEEELKEKYGEKTDISLKANPKGIAIKSGSGFSVEDSSKKSHSLTTEGQAIHRVHFGRVGAILGQLTKSLMNKRIWLLLDEWSAVPIELQPYLADLIRRALFPSNAVSVKIAAIEKRSRFQLAMKEGDYIGIELGGDASADLNMDDFMVFDNDEEKAIRFFRTLVFKHIKTLALHGKIAVPESETELVRAAFTQDNVFREFVRAAEGIPRDAFYILSLAAQKNLGSPISMDTIRKSSKTWYQRDKEVAVSANSEALGLLHWIIDEVIAHRRSRAFLLKRGVSSDLIDSLFDSRVLHLLKRNISAHDEPGVRYDVYKIDYGCYVDLLSTLKAPQGLFELETGSYVEVPPDDYRAIRRAILDMDKFEMQIINYD